MKPCSTNSVCDNLFKIIYSVFDYSFYHFLEIGANENSKTALRMAKNQYELFPISSFPVFDLHKPNRIRIKITQQNRVFVFVNGMLKYDQIFSLTPNFKYLSFATKNSSNVEYFFNCTTKKNQNKFGNLSELNTIFVFALTISLTVNVLTFFIIVTYI